MSRKIIRTVEWFDKKTEYLAGEEILKIFPVAEIREILKIPYDADDPELYDMYVITQESAIKLSTFMHHQFDFNQYDYFLSCSEATEKKN